MIRWITSKRFCNKIYLDAMKMMRPRTKPASIMSSALTRKRTPLRLSVGTGVNVALRVVLATLCLYAVQAAPVSSSLYIKSTIGEKEFNEAISSDKFSFVKFFHPSCPHCQAMAKDFDDLSLKISDHNHDSGTAANHTIAVIQVNAARKENHPVLATHASAFPTLKLFRSGKLIIEYVGPREAKPMYEFLMRALQLAERPPVTHLHTAKQVRELLRLARARPVVISLFQPRTGFPLETRTSASDHFPQHIQLSLTEWEDTVKVMHENTAPQTVFATVPSPDLLVPKGSQERFKRLASRYSVPPLLAAVPRADDFDTSAEWYFPGVRDGAPPSSFMHTAIVSSEEFVTLSKHNSPHILETTRPLAIAFGKGDTASYMEEHFLVSAAREASTPRMLPVYASMKNNHDLAEHVGLNVTTTTTGETDIDKLETQYVIYRFGNRGPVSSFYSKKDGKSVTRWIKTQAKALNGSDIMTSAGQVLELDLNSWRNLFEFDGRGVVLELYESDCASCKDLQRTSNSVAKELQPYAGSVVVARFDKAVLKLPSWPSLPNDTKVPGIVWVAPGEKPVTYDGYKSSRGIARFAMEMSGLQGNRISWVDVITSYLLLCGVILTFTGLMLMLRSRSRPHKREHIT